MEHLALAVCSLLPVVYWWRFRKNPVDRDYACYAYPAWQKTGYLTNGHIDIKPPLIHWLYKLWWILPIKPIGYKLRLMPLLAHVVTVYLLGLRFGWQASLVAGLLYANPYMWPHMANTEWIGNLCIAIAINLSGWQSQLILGFMWIANLKFIPFSIALGGYWAYKEAGFSIGIFSMLLQGLPFFLAVGYLIITKRLDVFLKYVIVMPKYFGKVRRLFTHTDIPLIKRALGIELLPFISAMDWKSEWTILSAWWMILNVASKQIVPHHLLMLIPLISASVTLTPMVLAAYTLTLLFRNLVVWKKPELLYAASFGDPVRGTDYGMMLKDSSYISKWILAETKPDETILVNGIDNEIYTHTGRKAYFFVLPEYWALPDNFNPPRVVVHCAMASQHCTWWYPKWDYKAVYISPMGLFTIMVKGRKDAIILECEKEKKK